MQENDRTSFMHYTKVEPEEHLADLASAMYFGAFDMLSIPPATTMSLIPSWIDCAAKMVAVERKENH